MPASHGCAGERGGRRPETFREEAAGRPMGVSGRAALWGFRRRRHDAADCVAAMSALRSPMIHVDARLIDALAR